MRIVGKLGEILLVRPESVFAAIHRGLDDGPSGIALFLPCRYRAENFPFGKPLHVLDHCLRQWERIRVAPQRIELISNPLDGIWIFVLPHEFEVSTPSGL